MEPVRRPALEGLAGTVVELGFGSGPNVGLYPPDVDRILAVEPSEGARALARKRMAGRLSGGESREHTPDPRAAPFPASGRRGDAASIEFVCNALQRRYAARLDGFDGVGQLTRPSVGACCSHPTGGTGGF